MLETAPASGLPAIVAETIGREVALPSFVQAFNSAKGYASEASAARTRREYAKAFGAFQAWCGDIGREALPASVETAAAYLASLADRGLKPSSIDLHVAAIAAAHRAVGFEPPTNAEPIRKVVRGIRNRLGSKVDRKAPATAETVKKILKRCPDTLIGRRDAALIALGFAAALRRSELVALEVSDLERTPEGVIVHIRKSKTDQEGAGHMVPVPAGSKLRPVQALDAWLSAAAITAGPLFRPIGKGGRVGAAALTDHSAAQIVKDRAAAVGLDPKFFAGHSLRAGFVTSALEAGADILKVMDVTRHTKVDTLKRYDRRAQAFKNHAGRGFL